MVHFLLTGKYTVYGLSSFIGHNREKETHKTFKKYGASAGDHTNFSKKSTDQRLIYTLIIQSHNHLHIQLLPPVLSYWAVQSASHLWRYLSEMKKAFISFFPFPICSHYVISLVDDWLSGWLIGWLGSCFPIRLWLCDWLTDCFSDFFSRWPTDWFSGGLCHHLLSLTSKDWGFRYRQRSHGKTKSDTSCISLRLGNFLPFGSLSPSWVP